MYNRPHELGELLVSLTRQAFTEDFEIVVIEDGSETTSKEVVNSFKDKLTIQYFYKENSGPGLSRNFGMQKASGTYFIILDSDVLLPEHYLIEVDQALKDSFY